MPVLGRQRSADHVLAKPRIVLAQARAPDHLQLETELRGCLGVAFELVEIGVAARELDMPGGHELAVRADELTQPTPDLA